MSNFPKDFRHIGVVEFTLETKQEKEKIVHNMILLYNTNYSTAEEALDLLRKNEYSDYMIAMPENIFNGIFRNAGFGGSPYGIVS